MERPRKRARMGNAPYDNVENNLTPIEALQDSSFQQSAQRWTEKLQRICAKYENLNDEDDDEIDLETGEIVIDNGRLRAMPDDNNPDGIRRESFDSDLSETDEEIAECIEYRSSSTDLTPGPASKPQTPSPREPEPSSQQAQFRVASTSWSRAWSMPPAHGLDPRAFSLSQPHWSRQQPPGPPGASTRPAELFRGVLALPSEPPPPKTPDSHPRSRPPVPGTSLKSAARKPSPTSLSSLIESDDEEPPGAFVKSSTSRQPDSVAANPGPEAASQRTPRRGRDATAGMKSSRAAGDSGLGDASPAGQEQENRRSARSKKRTQFYSDNSWKDTSWIRFASLKSPTSSKTPEPSTAFQPSTPSKASKISKPAEPSSIIPEPSSTAPQPSKSAGPSKHAESFEPSKSSKPPQAPQVLPELRVLRSAVHKRTIVGVSADMRSLSSPKSHIELPPSPRPSQETFHKEAQRQLSTPESRIVVVLSSSSPSEISCQEVEGQQLSTPESYIGAAPSPQPSMESPHQEGEEQSSTSESSILVLGNSPLGFLTVPTMHVLGSPTSQSGESGEVSGRQSPVEQGDEDPLSTPEVFSRNVLDPSYAFSDEEDGLITKAPKRQSRPAIRDHHSALGELQLGHRPPHQPVRQLASQSRPKIERQLAPRPEHQPEPEPELESQLQPQARPESGPPRLGLEREFHLEQISEPQLESEPGSVSAAMERGASVAQDTFDYQPMELDTSEESAGYQPMVLDAMEDDTGSATTNSRPPSNNLDVRTPLKRLERDSPLRTATRSSSKQTTVGQHFSKTPLRKDVLQENAQRLSSRSSSRKKNNASMPPSSLKRRSLLARMTLQDGDDVESLASSRPPPSRGRIMSLSPEEADVGSQEQTPAAARRSLFSLRPRPARSGQASLDSRRESLLGRQVSPSLARPGRLSPPSLARPGRVSPPRTSRTPEAESLLFDLEEDEPASSAQQRGAAMPLSLPSLRRPRVLSSYGPWPKSLTSTSDILRLAIHRRKMSRRMSARANSYPQSPRQQPARTAKSFGKAKVAGAVPVGMRGGGGDCGRSGSGGSSDGDDGGGRCGEDGYQCSRDFCFVCV